jgi:hypothetical protein
MLAQSKLSVVSLTKFGNLVARPASRWKLLRELDAVHLKLALEILESRVGRDVASPDATGDVLAFDSNDGEWRVVSEKSPQGHHSCPSQSLKCLVFHG